MAGDAGFEPTMRKSKSRALTNLANPHRWLAIQRGENGHLNSYSGIPAPLRSAGSDTATGPGEGIRTPGPLLPKQMRYQTALHPDINGGECGIRTRNATPFTGECGLGGFRDRCIDHSANSPRCNGRGGFGFFGEGNPKEARRKPCPAANRPNGGPSGI